MNSKAIKRQLFAAIAMVLVAAVALGSSTYAWFVASNSVTAEGMKVQAQSESGLAISYDGINWGTSASAGVENAVKLYPASTKSMTEWSHATAEKANAAKAAQTTREDITSKVFGGENSAYDKDNGYVFMREFKIRSTAPDAVSYGLYVKQVTVTGASKAMSTALRVGVRYDDAANANNSKAYIYAPVSVEGETPTNNYSWYRNAADENGSTVTLATPGKGSSDLFGDTVSIPSDASKAVKVQIYIWFEGEDAQLYSDNFNTESLSVTVDFSSIEPDTTTGA